jgi:hypothetical protein
MTKIYTFFGGRRYFFTQQLFGISVLLLYKDKISSDNFVELAIWILAIYAGANTVQKIGEAVKGRKGS